MNHINALSWISSIIDRSPAVIELQAHLSAIAMAWPLQLSTPNPGVDRCGSLLSGPLFISANHPWPQTDGRWLEPVVQVDLAWLGAVGDQSLGEGLAQVWTSARTAMVRIIPVHDVCSTALLPPPSVEMGDYHRRTRAVSDSLLPQWLNEGRAIIGVGTPFLDCDPNGLDYLIGEVLAESHVPSIRMVLERARAHFIEVEPKFVHRAFGMASGLPGSSTLPPVLLTIEEDCMISWNDGGSGHLCREAGGDLCLHSG